MKSTIPGYSLFCILLVLPLVFSSCSIIYDMTGGPYLGAPSDIFKKNNLTDGAKSLIDQAFEDFEGKVIVDYHVHFFANGKPAFNKYCTNINNENRVNPPFLNMDKTLQGQPFFLKPFMEGVYLDASDISDKEMMDQQTMKRLVNLVSFYGPPAFAGKTDKSPYKAVFYLMAMDGQYDSDGKLDKENSYGYVSNSYIIELEKCLNKKISMSGGFRKNQFKVVGSINPMRKKENGHCCVMRDSKDLMKQIKILRNNNVEFIKWRTPTMGFDPADVSDEFYKKLVQGKHKIGILTHSGNSEGIKAGDHLNQLAAPRRMERAVKNGVTVVLLHMGRTGKNEVTGVNYSEESDNFIYEFLPGNNNLYGEISAVPYSNTHHLLKKIIYSKQEFINRFVNSSDYPAVTPYIINPLDNLMREGWIEKHEKNSLDLIFRYNPLLFDFVMKRTIRVKITNRKGEVEKKKIPSSIFLGINRNISNRVSNP